jgi:hypothetical protein
MSKQDASMTHAHMICLLNKLCESGQVKTWKTTILGVAASSITAVHCTVPSFCHIEPIWGHRRSDDWHSRTWQGRGGCVEHHHTNIY